MGLQDTEEASAAVVKNHAHRVSLADMESKIAGIWHRTLDTMLEGYPASAADNRLAHVSVCVVLMDNGFVLIGKSAPVAPENFNADLGKKFAYEDAIRTLWPMEGYALRERLSAGGA